METTLNYKGLLNECLALRGQSGTGAYQRAVKLKAVYEDDEFRAMCKDAKKDPDTFLNEYVQDLCLDYLQLQQMLREFPEESAWGDGKLKSLHEQTTARIAERQQADRARHQQSQPRVKPGYKTLYQEVSKQLDETDAFRKQAEKNAREMETRASMAEMESDSKERRIRELESENRDLRHRLAEATSRISELESLLTLDGVAA